MIDKNSAKLEYKLSHRPMGVFQISNVTNGKAFVDSSLNIPGKINRHRFALNMGKHASKTLQADWNEFGEDAFAFEVLEDIPPRSNANYNYAADVATLENLWLEKLEPFVEKGYNEREMTHDERLKMIRENQRATLESNLY